MINGAYAEIEDANALGKKVVLGIELSKIDSEYGPYKDYETFNEEGGVSLKYELSKLASYYKDSSAFGGTAFESYYSYKQMK